MIDSCDRMISIGFIMLFLLLALNNRTFFDKSIYQDFMITEKLKARIFLYCLSRGTLKKKVYLRVLTFTVTHASGCLMR